MPCCVPLCSVVHATSMCVFLWNNFLLLRKCLHNHALHGRKPSCKRPQKSHAGQAARHVTSSLQTSRRKNVPNLLDMGLKLCTVSCTHGKEQRLLVKTISRICPCACPPESPTLRLTHPLQQATCDALTNRNNEIKIHEIYSRANTNATRQTNAAARQCLFDTLTRRSREKNSYACKLRQKTICLNGGTGPCIRVAGKCWGCHSSDRCFETLRTRLSWSRELLYKSI